VSLRERWSAQGDAWAAWAAAGREDDVLPQFLELVPSSSASVLDVGCGEGRLTRRLRARGHQVAGVDVAARLIELARESDPDGHYRIAAAEELPFEEGEFEVVVAFNVLMNVDDPGAAIRESARVLRPGGHLCLSIVHPLASAGAWQEDVFVVGDYLQEKPHEERVGELVFANVHRPLEAWSRFLEGAGLLVESLRELERASMPCWDRLPMFLFIRALKP
jgi:2-polyprenyl-3-methyl-5-hydroxy-6-metoxy-1,4-benzoquinol methylase